MRRLTGWGGAALAALFTVVLPAAAALAQEAPKKLEPGPGTYDLNNAEQRYELYAACMKAEKDEGAALIELAKKYRITTPDGSVDETALVGLAERFGAWAQENPYGAKDLVDRWEKENAGGGAPPAGGGGGGAVPAGGGAAPAGGGGPVAGGAVGTWDVNDADHRYDWYAASRKASETNPPSQVPIMEFYKKYGLLDGNGYPDAQKVPALATKWGEWGQKNPQGLVDLVQRYEKENPPK